MPARRIWMVGHVLGCLAGASCSPVSFQAGSHASPRASISTWDRSVIDSFGEALSRTVREAESAEAFRVRKEPGEAPPAGARTVGGAAVISGPVKLSAGQILRFGATLGKESSYLRNAGKFCIPTPGVGIRFTRGGDSADLLLCFECKILSLESDREEGASADFDPSYRRHVRLVKEVFPADPVIQALR